MIKIEKFYSKTVSTIIKMRAPKLQLFVEGQNIRTLSFYTEPVEIRTLYSVAKDKFRTNKLTIYYGGHRLQPEILGPNGEKKLMTINDYGVGANSTLTIYFHFI